MGPPETLLVSSSKNFLLATQRDLPNKSSVKVSHPVLKPRIGEEKKKKEREKRQFCRRGERACVFVGFLLKILLLTMESKGLGDATGFLLIIITTFMTEVPFFT